MAHRIDAEHDHDGGQVVLLRPGTVTAVPRTPAAAQPIPLRPAQGERPVSRKPIWDKDNFGFWLSVCILASLAFSIVWHAIA